MDASATKRVAKNAFWLLLGSSISKLIEFITIVYLARILTVSGFGLLSFAQAILIYLLLLVDGGLSVLGIRETAKSKENLAIVGINIFSLRIILALIVFIFSAIVLFSLKISLELKLLLTFTFLLLFPRAITSEWVFQGLERMEYVGISKVLQQLFFFGLVLLVIKNVNNLLAVPLLQFSSSLATSFIFLFILLRYFMPFSFKNLHSRDWFNYIMVAIPLGLSSVFIQIYYNLDVIMLGFMQRPEVVGWYNASYKLFYVFLGTMGVFSAAVFPIVCKKFEEGKEKAQEFLEKYLRLMLLGTFPAVLLGLLCSESAIRLIYGSSYMPGLLAFKILLLNILVIAISGIYGTLVLIPSGKNKEFMYSVGIGALCNLILNFILIPPFSLVGAAVATLLTEIIVVISFFYLGGWKIGINWRKYIVKPALAGGVAFLATYLILIILRFNDLLFFLSSILMFSGIYAIIIASTSEITFLKEFISEIIRTTKP
jgi:O-antigen/teichoic acid export membrane protein